MSVIETLIWSESETGNRTGNENETQTYDRLTWSETDWLSHLVKQNIAYYSNIHEKIKKIR